MAGESAGPAGQIGQVGTGDADGGRRWAALLFAATLAFVLSLAGSALKSTVTVYLPDIARDIHTTVEGFAWSTTIFAVGIAVASPLVGLLADRWGGSTALTVGTVLAGVAFLLCAAAPGVLQFAPVYGVLGSVAFTMLSYVPLGKLADELFAGRGEGLAYAAMTNGPAVGFIVLVPLWVWVGSLLSWRTVFLLVGVVMLVALAPLAVLLGRLSAGDEPAAPSTPQSRQGTGSRLRTLLTDRDYVMVTLAFGGCGITMAFVDVHLVNHLNHEGMSGGVVSGTLSLLGLFELMGGLVAGRLCDRGLIRSTLVTGYALRALAMLVLLVVPGASSAFGFGVVFGASYMVTVVATTLWIGRLLPTGVKATGLGVLWLVHQIGAALSSQVGAYIEQRADSYGPVVLTESALVVLSALLVLQLPAPGPPGSRNGTPETASPEPSRPVPPEPASEASGTSDDDAVQRS
ncbi:MFS transporter [Kineosporia sp. J2-2]|uniref:MFS transporter n=1 Tax=Kineosporia corallincola TaxID=2835133 RepID=A0ABS5TCB8_9ACTN|nr:MFS transporter [Kineosporia corallincola]MBT0768725.1 MFS transporter [Kineosporia corallincola]